MKSKSVLIIGGSGFIGSHLALRLVKDFKVFSTFLNHPFYIPGVSSIPLDVTDRNSIKRVIYATQPEVIIYCAGKNSIDTYEANPKDAEIIHTNGVVNVSTCAEILQPKFILISNCFVFDGKKGNYKETDITVPPSALGKTKIGGENFLKGKSLNYIIVRSSPLFGRGNYHHHSFLDRLRISLHKKALIEFSDVETHSFAPIYGLAHLIERIIVGEVKNEIFHYGGLTKTSYFDFAKRFCNSFNLDGNLIVKARDIQNGYSDYSLNSSLIYQKLNINPLVMKEGFDLIQNHLIVA